MNKSDLSDGSSSGSRNSSQDICSLSIRINELKDWRCGRMIWWRECVEFPGFISRAQLTKLGQRCRTECTVFDDMGIS